MSPTVNDFYLRQEEPLKGMFLTMREIIISVDKNITNELKYGMPFFCFRGKMFCYLWKDKSTKEPYLGLVEGQRISHPSLEKGNRARMKILRLDPHLDIPVELIQQLVNSAIQLYISGEIKIKGIQKSH